MFKSQLKSIKKNKDDKSRNNPSTSRVSSSNALQNLPLTPPPTSCTTPQRPLAKLDNTKRNNKKEFDFGFDLDDLDWNITLPSFEVTSKINKDEISKRSEEILHDLSIREDANRSKSRNCDLEETFLKTIESSKQKNKLNLSDQDKDSIVSRLKSASNQNVNNLQSSAYADGLELSSFGDDIWFEEPAPCATTNEGNVKTPNSSLQTPSSFCNLYDNKPIMISAQHCERASRLFESMDCLLLGEIGYLIWRSQKRQKIK